MSMTKGMEEADHNGSAAFSVIMHIAYQEKK